MIIPKDVIISERVALCDFLNEGTSYVYFLIDGEEIVYVGQTVDYVGRIKSHRNGNTCEEAKQFTHVTLLKTDVTQKDLIELIYIDVFKPRYNKQKITKDQRLRIDDYLKSNIVRP